MKDYEMDLYDLETLIRTGRECCFGCQKVFRNTNERLEEIYEEFDFRGKDVFTVMSSADQVFSAYYLGANRVDTFDHNPTTYYYFYLRKWFLMYYQKNILNGNSKILQKVLIKQNRELEEEREVARVWNELFGKCDDISRLFIDDIYDWNVPYVQDIKRTIEIIKDKQANFTRLNLFKEIQVDKKYDIVILSNILESISPESEANQIVCQNFRKILKENGIVICSILNDKYENKFVESEAFKPYFDYSLSLKKRHNNYVGKEMPLYYTYQKKS